MSLVSCCARRWLTVFGLVFLAVGGRAVRAETPADMPRLFPERAIAFVELSGLGEKLEQLRNSEQFAAWLASPQYRRYETSQDYRRLLAARQIVERQLGRDIWAIAKSLLSGNVAVGVYPKEGNPRPDVLAVLRTEDPAALADLRQQLDPLLVLAADQFRRTESLAALRRTRFPRTQGSLPGKATGWLWRRAVRCWMARCESSITNPMTNNPPVLLGAHRTSKWPRRRIGIVRSMGRKLSDSFVSSSIRCS